MNKAKLRLIGYAFAIGTLGIGSLVCFNLAQYNKAKYKSSSAIVDDAVAKLTSIYSTNPNALVDASDERAHDKALWYNDIYETFYVINEQNKNAYVYTALPAYALSTFTLVAFGLILKIEEKAKEKEDAEVIK